MGHCHVSSLWPLTRTISLLAVASLLAGAAVACGDSGDDSASVSPTASIDPKKGPLALSIETEDAPTLKFELSGDISSYHLTGTLRYGPTCEARDAGETDFDTVSLDDEIDGTASEFVLPASSDERLDVLVEAAITLEAQGGDEAVKDSIAFTADPICE